MQRKDLLAIASLMVATLLLAGIFTALIKPSQDETDDGVLPSFRNYNQVRLFLGVSGHQQTWNNTMEMGASDMIAASAPDDVRYSDTNVQVEGVDEADSVKTDGQYFYLTAADSVSILNAYPASDLSNLSKVDIRTALDLDLHYSVWINGIYILQEKLVVIVSIAGPYQYYNTSDNPPVTAMIWRMPEQKTVVAIFSLVDIENPILVKSFGISGYPITSRMSGDCVYVLSQQCICNRDDLISPKIFEDDGIIAMAATRIHYDPSSHDISSFINIMAIDVEAMESNHTSVLAGYTSTVYMSHSALFLTFQKTSDGGMQVLGETDAATSGSSAPQYSTSIYRIDIDGLSIVPAARGAVPGWLLNQFSMDETDGYLRVATTSGWVDTSNDVYILDSHLNITGKLEGLALNERIFASRFIGDMLYIVTFRQVDPLFVINLTDPANPCLVGELKVPGFSVYLHPVDANHLIGVGMIGGSVKVSLFDVSDPEHPSELSNVTVPGWSYTEALYDYKAVLYDPELELLVLPITSYDDRTWNVTSAAYLFKVNGTQMETAGMLTVPRNEYLMRAHYIGEYLYTITDTTIRAYQTSDLEMVNELVYQDRNEYYFPCLMGTGEVVAVAAVM